MTRHDWLLAITVMVIWGFNFSMIKMGVTTVNPLLATAVRFALAVIPAIFFIARPPVAWRYLVSYGVVFGIGVWGMASWSITAGLSSGISSLLLSTDVLIGMIVGICVFKEHVSYRQWAGAVLAMGTLAMLILAAKGNVTVNGVVLIMIAACSWTLMCVIVKAARTTQAFAFSVWGMLFAPIPLVVFAVLLQGDQVLWQTLRLWNWQTTVAVAFQAYPTTLFGYWVWNRILIKYPLSTTAPLTLLAPIFALLSGYFLYDETLSPVQMISSVLFLLGIGLIVKPAGSGRFKLLKKTEPRGMRKDIEHG